MAIDHSHSLLPLEDCSWRIAPGVGQFATVCNRIGVTPHRCPKMPYKHDIKTPGGALDTIMAVWRALGKDALLFEMKLSDEQRHRSNIINIHKD